MRGLARWGGAGGEILCKGDRASWPWQDRRKGLSGQTWCRCKFQWEVGVAVSAFETPCDEVPSSSWRKAWAPPVVHRDLWRGEGLHWDATWFVLHFVYIALARSWKVVWGGRKRQKAPLQKLLHLVETQGGLRWDVIVGTRRKRVMGGKPRKYSLNTWTGSASLLYRSGARMALQFLAQVFVTGTAGRNPEGGTVCRGTQKRCCGWGL